MTSMCALDWYSGFIFSKRIFYSTLRNISRRFERNNSRPRFSMFTNTVPYELNFMNEIPRVLMKRCAIYLAQSVTQTILRREIPSTKYHMNDTALRDISSKACRRRPNVARYFVLLCKGGLERLQTRLDQSYW